MSGSDRFLENIVKQSMGGGPVAQPPQQTQTIDMNQLLAMVKQQSNITGTSLTGWADLIKAGVLTPEQVFTLVFSGQPPTQFLGHKTHGTTVDTQALAQLEVDDAKQELIGRKINFVELMRNSGVKFDEEAIADWIQSSITTLIPSVQEACLERVNSI